jgi:hypothetical protein
VKVVGIVAAIVARVAVPIAFPERICWLGKSEAGGWRDWRMLLLVMRALLPLGKSQGEGSGWCDWGT